MLEMQPILLAAIAGYVCAIVFASFPVGPINLTILNEGTQRGFRWAMMIGFGASLMDAIYCSISFSGLSQFLENSVVKAFLQLFTFVFLLALGSKFFFARAVSSPSRLNTASEKLEARIEQKLHPHSAFMTGFVRVMGNVGVLLAYLVVAAYLMSTRAPWLAQDWVQDTFPAKAACIGGVLLGTNTWYLCFSFFVSRGQGRFSDAALLRLQQFSGICLISAALFNGTHIVWLLAQHARHPH